MRCFLCHVALITECSGNAFQAAGRGDRDIVSSALGARPYLRRMPLFAAESVTEPRQPGHVLKAHASHWLDGTIQQRPAKRTQSGAQESPPHAPERRNGGCRCRQDGAGESGGQPATAGHPAIMVSRLPGGRRRRRKADRGGRIASGRLKSAEGIRLRGPFICHVAAPVGLLNTGGNGHKTQAILRTLPPHSVPFPPEVMRSA